MKQWLRRLKSSGLPLDNELIKKGEKFYSCSCHTYMHYSFCLHSCVYSMVKKLIIGYPPTLDPRKINPNAGIGNLGRPAKVRPGTALTKG